MPSNSEYEYKLDLTEESSEKSHLPNDYFLKLEEEIEFLEESAYE